MAPSTQAASDSKTALTNELVRLLETENIDNIQVRELCAGAGVSRTTFYRHYEGIDDFVQKTLESFGQEMDDAFFFGNVFLHALDVSPETTFLTCVEFMANHADFVRAMCSENGPRDFEKHIVELWTNQLEEAIALRAPQIQATSNLEITACFVASAMWGLLKFDILGGCKYERKYLAGQMSNLFYGCVLRGLIDPRRHDA